jgi:hypothetical protein
MKGVADGGEFGFRLQTLVVGKDDDGDDETTCVVEFTDSTRQTVVVQQEPKGAGRKAIMTMAVNMLLLGDGVLSRNELVTAAAAERPRGDGVRDQRMTNVNRDIGDMISAGYFVESKTGMITLPVSASVQASAQ